MESNAFGNLHLQTLFVGICSWCLDRLPLIVLLFGRHGRAPASNHQAMVLYCYSLYGTSESQLVLWNRDREAAESSLAGGGHEAPPFLAMCQFLALRALGDVNTAERPSWRCQAVIWNRLTAQQKAGLASSEVCPSLCLQVLAQEMPPLAAGGGCWVSLKALNHAD